MKCLLAKVLSVFLALSLASCATFDKTNILPGQRVQGLGFSFAVPTENAWFAVVYGNSHRIRLSQLNMDDSYILEVALNKGPRFGMYPTATSHLFALKQYRADIKHPEGYIEHEHQEWVAEGYGDICVRYSESGENSQGRVIPGVTEIETIGLACAHPSLNNVLINIELSRRSESYAEEVDLNSYAEALFASFEYEELD